MNDILTILFKKLVWYNLIEAVLERLFVSMPLLAWGPIGVVVSWIVTSIGEQLFKALQTSIDVTAIKLKNVEAQKEWERTSIRLWFIAEDEGINSEKFKQAREYEKEAFSKFVRFNVAR